MRFFATAKDGADALRNRAEQFAGAVVHGLEVADGGLRAAERAGGVARHLHLAEGGLERVKKNKASGERGADAEQLLHHLVGLQGAQGAGQRAEHADVGAALFGVARLRAEEAAITRRFALV